MNNKKVKEAYLILKVPAYLDNKVYDMTIYKKEKKRIKLQFVSIVCLLLIVFISLGIVYAKDIKEVIKGWSASKILDDGTKIEITNNSNFKRIPDSIIKTEDGNSSIKISHQEMEKELGFKLINYELISSDVMFYNTGLNEDNSVGRLDIWWPEFINEEDKKVSMHISILNENANDGYIEAFLEGIHPIKDFDTKYKSNNLNVDVVLSHTDDEIEALFVYDDILYWLVSPNLTKQQLQELIEKLN